MYTRAAATTILELASTTEAGHAPEDDTPLPARRSFAPEACLPVIRELRKKFNTIARAEAKRAARALRVEGADQRALIDEMADAIVSKLLRLPSASLETTSDPALTSAARRLFKLKQR